MNKFVEAFPISFDLIDQDTQNVLYITDAADQELILEIKNSGNNGLRFDPLSGSVGPEQYHFALHFRPGTLSRASLGDPLPQYITLKAENLAKWECSQPITDADGMDVIYLRSRVAQTLEVGNIASLAFIHVGADARQGARGTRVKLSYANLTFSDGSAIKPSAREIHMDIINHRGNALARRLPALHQLGQAR